MRLAGLRHDDEAVTVGRTLVRDWVTNGTGPQTRDDIRRQVADRNLLARDGTLVLAVNAIDNAATSMQPNVVIDIVDLYDGGDSFSRVKLRDPDDWANKVAPAVQGAARQLETFGPRRVHVVGWLRLPLWFAIGRALPDVRGWVLSLDQRNVEWATDAVHEDAPVRVLLDEDVGGGDDIAIAIAMTHDPTAEVRQYLDTGGPPVRRLLMLGPEGEPGPTSVPSAGWAAAWVRNARDRARAAATSIGAPRAHLFMAAPAGVALMLGHQWNLMPPTMVYEHLRPSYAPTLQVS